ncbi:hypothetical protein [Pseudoalteromonas rubra]|uniref:hypothetical protein n=1 Tax=Pseudoalteromonas rubra TaxID=43658 RepID=UPI000AF7FABD|nr:hypothetical protein [Pseudoalteromonas rubra]
MAILIAEELDELNKLATVVLMLVDKSAWLERMPFMESWHRRASVACLTMATGCY